MLFDDFTCSGSELQTHGAATEKSHANVSFKPENRPGSETR